ncbi:MarR family transcriptional regulator [Gangjinia marincola]|uniref:MarR family transcriptional regulator n=1 Tax=Gangjinia marincola TaxID=578463 RepID=A0ABN1MIZ7_9FLAO
MIETTQQLERKAVITISTTGNLVIDQLAEAFKPYDISLPQFNVLRILRGQKGKPASLQCVQDKMLHKMSNTTRLVDKLIAKGYVCREVCSHNRRKIEITLTQGGLEFINSLDRVLDQTEHELTKNYTQQELETLIHLLQKMNT